MITSGKATFAVSATAPCTVAVGLVVLALHSAARAGEAAPPAAWAAGPVLTGKERLSSKGADEQRVDNCKVAPNRRGPKERPDLCHDGAGPAPSQ